MIHPTVSYKRPFLVALPKLIKSPPRKSVFQLQPMHCCIQHQNPNTVSTPQIMITPLQATVVKKRKNHKANGEGMRGLPNAGSRQLMAICGFGYWMQGFRCFPWLALNFHMAHNLNVDPSTLQLIQNSGNLPMVAKPLYGILSDAICINGAHRIPYICIGVLLQVLSWGPLALIPVAREALPTLIACIILSNCGASITEVAKDALIAEYGQQNKIRGLQSYAFMASAAGGILGNLIGGYFLLKLPPQDMFLIFSIILTLQLGISCSTTEESLCQSQHWKQSLVRKSISEIIRKQMSVLVPSISEDKVSQPLVWIVASIVMVPFLSGSMFCYQTQHLNLDPSVFGLSRVVGQLVLLSATVLYDRYWKNVPMRKLVGVVQILYALCLLLDLVLVKQLNLVLGISNQVFVLCFSALAEALAQFKLLPFTVLIASLAPQGCEGSVTSFLASALCLSSILSGFLGVGLASFLGITSGNYTGLPIGILIQFFAALVPLKWLHFVPMSLPITEKGRKRGESKRTRKSRRIGRVVLGSVYAYRRERESEVQSKWNLKNNLPLSMSINTR